MKTITITGSSGFIGKHLVKYLKSKNYEIIEFDVKSGIDISKWKDIEKIAKFDIIVHLAAKSFVPESFKKPYEFYKNNINTTLNVLELARKHEAKVIYFSSYLYGTPKYLPIDEKHPLSPHNPYAQSKLICEKLCEGYHRDFHVPIIIFRPFNIYGPGQSSHFLIPGIIEQFSKGEIVLKDPRPKRDFIHISDVIVSVLHAIEFNSKELEVFNLGTGKSYSVEEVVNYLTSNARVKPKLIYTNEYRQSEVLDTVADISKISAKFNWKPEVDLQQGLHAILNS